MFILLHFAFFSAVGSKKKMYNIYQTRIGKENSWNHYDYLQGMGIFILTSYCIIWLYLSFLSHYFVTFYPVLIFLFSERNDVNQITQTPFSKATYEDTQRSVLTQVNKQPGTQ